MVYKKKKREKKEKKDFYSLASLYNYSLALLGLVYNYIS